MRDEAALIRGNARISTFGMHGAWMQRADDGRDVRCARLAIAGDLPQGSAAYAVYPGRRASILTSGEKD